MQRRWLNQYNKRIREEVGTELKERLKMKAFYWMMMKTMTIPESSSNSQDFFPDYSRSTPSVRRQFHFLVMIVAIYHVVASKRCSTNLRLIIVTVNNVLRFLL